MSRRAHVTDHPAVLLAAAAVCAAVCWIGLARLIGGMP